MTETTASAAPATPAAATPKKTKAPKKRGTGAKPSHPPTSQMVNAAIAALKERGGSSVQAIKKYISSNYKTDAEKLAPFIKKYLKSAVAAGTLTQTKGKGASGSFKLAGSKPSAGGGEGKPAARSKSAAPRAKKQTGTKAAAKRKSSAPSKAKKTTKPPTKPKTPKPKKAKPGPKTPSAPKSPKPKKSPAAGKKAAAGKKTGAGKKK